MKSSICTLTLAAIASVATAQPLVNFEYEARVTDVNDPNGLFTFDAAGTAASGSFTFDLGADVDNFGDFDGLGLDFSLFDIPDFDTSVSDQDFTGFDNFTAVVNDLQGAINGFASPDPQDGILVIGSLQSGDTSGKLNATFVGNNDLISDTGIPGQSVISLDNLTLAEVTIEFSVFIGDPNDPLAFVNPDNYSVSTATLEITSISSDGQTVARLACNGDVNDNGEVDIGDFTAWLGFFNNPTAEGAYRADINGDGQIEPTDFTAWLAEFNAGCSVNG